MLYLWLKVFHIIFVITWMAAIFYLPRLFVYHAMSEDKPSRERFKIMERKLYRGIMTPSMVLATFFGAWIIITVPGFLQGGWLHVKLTFALALIGYHFWCGHIMKQLRDDKSTKSHVWFRWFNELPVVALIVIVIMVVIKPF